jgi:catechol 2,3-dioxygenase-like lactoylglutathione lyase family enzyme
MTVHLNHTIVAARDKDKSALFLAEILGLPAPTVLGHFAGVKVGDTTLDFMDTEKEIVSQHYAFLVSEAEFDAIFARIRERQLPYWADPFQRERGVINCWDDGRGIYFEDPNGHILEALTRPYGAGGTAVEHPHPLVAHALKPEDANNGNSPARASGGGSLCGAERPDIARKD